MFHLGSRVAIRVASSPPAGNNSPNIWTGTEFRMTNSRIPRESLRSFAAVATTVVYLDSLPGLPTVRISLVSRGHDRITELPITGLMPARTAIGELWRWHDEPGGHIGAT